MSPTPGTHTHSLSLSLSLTKVWQSRSVPQGCSEECIVLCWTYYTQKNNYRMQLSYKGLTLQRTKDGLNYAKLLLQNALSGYMRVCHQLEATKGGSRFSTSTQFAVATIDPD